MSIPETPASRLRRRAYWFPVIVPAILILTYVGFYSYFLFCSTDSAACSPVSSAAILAAINNVDEPRVAIYVARASWTLISGLYLLACLAGLFTAGFVIYEALSNTGITSQQKLVDNAKSIANQALQTTVG